MRTRPTPRWRRWTLAAALLPLLAACGDDPTGPQDPEDVQFADVLGIELSQMTRLPSGVYIRTTRAGQDPAVTETSTIRVAYDLWLPDGTPVDSGGFTLRLNQLIDGFGLGVLGMKTGEIRWLVIPSELGYGAAGQGPIPPHSVLVFQVEMLQVT